jgi:hypothetical protein
MPLSLAVRKPAVWTKADWLLMRLTGVFLAMGIASHVLPSFGLQFRKLAHLGNAAPVAGTVMISLGVFLGLYVFLLKGKMMWVIAAATSIVVLAVGALLVVGSIESGRMQAHSQAMRESIVAQGGTGGQPAPALAVQAGRPPSMPTESRQTFDESVADMRSKFGVSRIVVVEVSGAKGVDLGATMRRTVDALPQSQRPARWRATTAGDKGNIVLAPIETLDAVSSLLSFGNVEVVSEGERLLHITLDHSKCVPSKE